MVKANQKANNKTQQERDNEKIKVVNRVGIPRNTHAGYKPVSL